ncbi:unnamed protein product [marine sediment metagenome]|uniref:Uncharacterized protein n=1 Tax=marine sediment metagenome TaxID=412755 RepID=X0UZ71_9ZZZZ
MLTAVCTNSEFAWSAVFIEIIAPTIMAMKLDMVTRPTEQKARMCSRWAEASPVVLPAEEFALG